MKSSLIIGLASFLWSCNSSKPLATVNEVDLERYLGRWYDIAHLPQRFQSDCKCVTADYRQVADYVEVINTCVDINTGDTSRVKGKAHPKEEGDNSRLKVRFFWPFSGDYYILALEDDYSSAMVGTPDRKGLWILGRRPEPAALTFKKYLNRAEELGFDTSQLEYTDQSCHVKPIQEN